MKTRFNRDYPTSLIKFHENLKSVANFKSKSKEREKNALLEEEKEERNSFGYRPHPSSQPDIPTFFQFISGFAFNLQAYKFLPFFFYFNLLLLLLLCRGKSLDLLCILMREK